MSVDMTKYLALYVSESTEHLDALAKDLVKLESTAPAGRTVLCDACFRHAHSVKGMAASMGFEATATLAHRLEDLLAAVRDGFAASPPTGPDKPTIDLLLAGTDALQGHVRATADSRPLPEASAVLEALNQQVARVTGKAPEPTRVADAHLQPAPTAPAPTLAPPPRYQVRLKVSPTCTTPGVRGFLAYKRLTVLGNVFDLKPAIEEVKAGKMPQGEISLELETAEPEAGIQKTLKTIADIELLSLKLLVPDAPPSAPTPGTSEAAPTERVVGADPPRTVRVRTELLDALLDSAAELLLATSRAKETGRVLPAAFRGPVEESVDRVHALVRELHGKVMKARMTPLSLITDRLPRACRDIARRRSREVELTMTGVDIELDRATVDELNDPLLHLLRNAVDHGLEAPEERSKAGKPQKGRVTVTVRRNRDHVLLEVEDDGRGMDDARLRTLAVERGLLTAEHAASLSRHDALMLCCLPGVSTASDVTDVSGRGVGMDAVKRAVESAGGSLGIESERGKGTRIRLSLPLTVAVVNLLLVQAGGETLGLPVARVAGVTELPRSALSSSPETTLLPFGATLVPVHRLSKLLQLENPGAEKTDVKAGGSHPFVVVEGEDGRLALEVERLLGQEEVVLKALSKPLDLVPGLSGVTILGSGKPVFILDTARLLTR